MTTTDDLGLSGLRDAARGPLTPVSGPGRRREGDRVAQGVQAAVGGDRQEGTAAGATSRVDAER